MNFWNEFDTFLFISDPADKEWHDKKSSLNVVQNSDNIDSIKIGTYFMTHCYEDTKFIDFKD